MNFDASLVVLLIVIIAVLVTFVFGMYQLKKYLDACVVFNLLKDFETSTSLQFQNSIPCHYFDFINHPPGAWGLTRRKEDIVKSVRLAESQEALFILPAFSGAKVIPWAQIEGIYTSEVGKELRIKLKILNTEIRLFMRVWKEDFDRCVLLKSHISSDPNPDLELTRKSNELNVSLLKKVLPVLLLIALALIVGQSLR